MQITITKQISVFKITSVNVINVRVTLVIILAEDLCDIQ